MSHTHYACVCVMNVHRVNDRRYYDSFTIYMYRVISGQERDSIFVLHFSGGGGSINIIDDVLESKYYVRFYIHSI